MNTKETPMLKGLEQSRWGWLLIFTSTTTMICCALPILLVTIGFGAVSAAIFSNLPFLVVLAHYKVWLFAGSGVMLALAGWALYRPGRACPTDPALAARCEAADRWNRRLLMVSAGMWAIGFTAAYLSLPLLGLYEKFFAG
jgi:mercuric ion transport protein